MFTRTKLSPIYSSVFSTGYVVQCPVLVFLIGKPARRNKHQQTERERESGLSRSGLSREEFYFLVFYKDKSLRLTVVYFVVEQVVAEQVVGQRHGVGITCLLA